MKLALGLRRVYQCIIGLVLILGVGVLDSSAQEITPTKASPPTDKPTKLVYGAATNFPPYDFLDSQGNPTGFNVELARELAKDSGVELEIRLGPWPQIVKQFEAGEIDFVSFAYSDSRAKKYDYFPAIWTLRLALLFAPDRQSYPQRLDQLPAETVAVQENTLVFELLNELPEPQRPAIRVISNLSDGIQLLEKGQVTTVVSYELALRKAATEAGIQFVVVPVKSVSFHFVTQKGRKNELPNFELAMENVRRSGKFDQLVERYLVASTDSRSWRDYTLYFVALIAVIAVISLGAFVWNRSLQRQVRARTRELAASEARVSSIVETAADGIITINNKGEIGSFNAAAAKIFGYDSKEIIGSNVKLLIPSLFNKDNDETDISSLAINESEAFPLRRHTDGQRKDGKTFPIELSISVISGSQERTFTLIVRDMTEQKHLEEQLRQAQKMEAVGRLAGGIAHDFNNLLTGIMGYTSILLMRQGNESPHYRSLNEIKKASERAASLTKQLLAFSRKQVLAPKITNLNTIINDFEPMLRRLIGENIEIITRLDPSLAMINADPGQLEQVIMNLAVNARDAMPQGGTLTIATANVESENDFPHQFDSNLNRYVMLTVRDTGHGMSEETKLHIFEPFYSTKDQGMGTGLGLATVYGIVKQSGGYIDVSSKLHHGTVFNIYFPATSAVSEPVEDQKKSPTTEDMLRGSGTILLVEDEDLVREFAADTLRACGYDVLTASNGQEAIQLCKQHHGPIELLITDVVMPGISGRELVERLPKVKPITKVLFISGYTDDALVHNGVFEQTTALLHKPFATDDLTHAVRELIEETNNTVVQ